MGEMTDDLIAEEEHLASLEVPPWDAGTDPATTEELLAAALHDSDCWHHAGSPVPHSSELSGYEPCRQAAAAILATEAGQALARLAAIGSAVERLGIGWQVTMTMAGDVEVNKYITGQKGSAPTLPAAIAAALGTERA